MSLYGSLYSGVTALNSFSSGLSVIGNNIANVNTTGYKSDRAEYSDNFSQMLSASNTNVNVSQLGTGVNVAAVTSNWSQGDISDTGIETDLYISGDGFFHLLDPVTNSDYATRAGSFILDNEGYLTSASGLRVQGVDTLGANGTDIQIPSTVNGLGVLKYAFDETGTLSLYLEDDSVVTAGQVSLYEFTNPYGLVNMGSGVYGGVHSSLVGTVTEDVPGAQGLGTIIPEALELSNVDLTKQFSDMIITQRAFQGGSRVITTTDELMEEAINLKR